MRSVRATVGDILPAAAERFGSATAVEIEGGKRFSYEALESAAARAAGGFARLGVRRGERVVLHLANGWEWAVAYHALARLGAVIAPANVLLTAPEVAYIATDSEASLLVVGAQQAAATDEVLRQRPAMGVVVVGADAARAGATAFEDLCSAPTWEGEPAKPQDLFIIGYTSGTTGRPKGAMLTQRAVFESAAMTATSHVRSREDVVVSALPFSHVYGNIVMNASLLAGARLVLLGRFEAEQALRTIEASRATLFEGVPTMYYQMLASLAVAPADISSLRRCTVGGQTMPTPLMEQVVNRLGCPLLELWGMTEVAGPAVTHSPYWPQRLGSIGRAFVGTETRIVDPGSRQPVEPGERGELQIRGPLVMQGYWRQPQATAECLGPDGWLSTGDVAWMDDDGYLYIIDRLKEVIITGGYNIYPTEVEQVVAAHPAVSMVAVAATPDAEKGELSIAYVVLRQPGAASAAELQAHCRVGLAAYKVPKRFVFVSDLPKTSTGKISRRALRDSPPQPETTRP